MPMLTIAEANRRLSHSTEAALRAQIVKGHLTAHRVGSRIYLDEAELRQKYGILFKHEDGR